VEKPKAKDPADIVLVATHTEELRGQGFALRLIKRRQEIRAAQEHQGGDITYRRDSRRAGRSDPSLGANPPPRD